MIYKQLNEFLRYKNFSVSSHLYAYNPDKPSHKLRFKAEKGSYILTQIHNHLAIEVLRVLTGDMIAVINGTRINAKPGDILFLNPFDLHYLITVVEDVFVQYQCINFDIDILKNKGHAEFNQFIDDVEQGKIRFKNHIPAESPECEELSQFMQDVHEVYVGRQTVSMAAYMKIFADLMAFTAVMYDGGHSYKSGSGGLSSQAEFSSAVVRYVSKNYAKQISIDEMANELHINKFYFCRTFRAIFDQTFGEYLNRFRILVAKNLTLDENRSIYNIAEAVGYNNYNVFSAHFKKIMGMQPKDYYK